MSKIIFNVIFPIIGTIAFVTGTVVLSIKKDLKRGLFGVIGGFTILYWQDVIPTTLIILVLAIILFFKNKQKHRILAMVSLGVAITMVIILLLSLNQFQLLKIFLR